MTMDLCGSTHFYEKRDSQVMLATQWGEDPPSSYSHCAFTHKQQTKRKVRHHFDVHFIGPN